MKTKYEQIVNTEQIATLANDENIPEIIAYGKSENMSVASGDSTKTLLIAIDVQNDFMENIGTLGVPNSQKDIEHLTHWIYNNVSKLSQIICSMDTHSITQIFHADWWVDKDGNSPSPFTIITYQEVNDGKWIPRYGDKQRSLNYLQNIEIHSKKQLCIWPYHCLAGTVGAKLESQFVKMLYFHAAARNSQPQFIQKGMDPYTEMYGIIKAEYDEDNYFNRELLTHIENYDAIYLAGEASSHCVLASTIQIVEYFADRKDITSRITLLEDCMSPISGFEASTKQQYEELQNKYGIKIKKSSEVIL